MQKHQPWQTLERFVEIRSPWLTLIGEKIRDDRDRLLDYWRVEKADSAIAIPLQDGQIFLPAPAYRPGVGKATLDFPGGRILPGQQPADAIPGILERELGVCEEAIARFRAINATGWAINSSFSNQKLYGFVAELSPAVAIAPEHIGATYPATSEGIRALLNVLVCLQCRAVLLEWCNSRDDF